MQTNLSDIPVETPDFAEPLPPVGVQEFTPDDEYYSRPTIALGAAEVALGISDIVVGFRGLSDGLKRHIEKKYGPFISTAVPIDIVDVCVGDTSYLVQPPGELRIEERISSVGKQLLSWDFAAMRSQVSTIPGRICVSNPTNLEQTSRAMENYLRWVTADLALVRSSFIIHSAGIVRDGKAYLFFGPSGAGKSTVVSLSQGDKVLSDDLVLVRLEEQGFKAYSTPFYGSFPQEQKTVESFPLAGLFGLHKSEEVKSLPLPLPIAVGAVIASCPFLVGESGRFARLFPLIEKLCQNVPVSRLYFRMDATFWDAVSST